MVLLLAGVACWTAAGAEPNWRISSVGVREMNFLSPSDGTGYTVVTTNAGAGIERRCYFDGHHFLSVLNENGIFALRPHPGVDRNGWGTTLYLQPFLSGAVLRASVVTNCTAFADRIEVGATGLVSRGTSDQYGTWGAGLTCAYDRLNKCLNGTGSYTIQLAGVLDEITGDLTLAKLASNYLEDVPLVDGTTNDTGDMASAHVVAGTLVTNWNPSLLPGYFPTDQTSNLLVNLVGAFNCVDTAAQGYHAIQAAYKPGVSLVLASWQPDIPMVFGGYYDTGKAKDFTADNVGITPLVLKSSTATQFQFDVTIESVALPGDGIGVMADLAATGTNSGAVEVYYTDSLGQPFRRYVGNLDPAGGMGYTGTVAVPFPESLPTPVTGFFRLSIMTNEIPPADAEYQNPRALDPRDNRAEGAMNKTDTSTATWRDRKNMKAVKKKP